MPTTELREPYVKVLAERLIVDIHRRGLTMGERYMTTEEVSRSLGVGKAAAGKAMRHLAQRGILIVRQRSGTFVGPGVAKHRPSKVKNIHVLLPAGDPSATHFSYNLFISGIRKAIPEINVQFTFVPASEPVPYVQELIDGSRAAGQFAGVIAASCPAEVYSLLADLQVPAVIFGSPWSADLPITSVDADNFQSGRLLAQYLIGRGHRRMAFLMASVPAPGVNGFVDGICDGMASSGLGPNALIHRLVGQHADALQGMVKGLLAMPDRPTAMITRGTYPADAITSIAMNAGLVVPDDLEIVFDHSNEAIPCLDTALYARVEPTQSFTEIATMIGRLVKELSRSASTKPQHMVIPVELHEPDRKIQLADAGIRPGLQACQESPR